MNKGYTHETKIIKRGPRDQEASDRIKLALKSKERLDTNLVGFAVVGVYASKFKTEIEFLSLSENFTKEGTIPEVVASGAIRDLARHCMRDYGKKPPKLIGEKDAEEIN